MWIAYRYNAITKSIGSNKMKRIEIEEWQVWSYYAVGAIGCLIGYLVGTFVN